MQIKPRYFNASEAFYGDTVKNKTYTPAKF